MKSSRGGGRGFGLGVLTLMFHLTVAVAPGAAQVGTWAVAGRVQASVTVRGRTVHRGARFRGTFVIDADGTYRQPGNLLCGGSRDLGDEDEGVPVTETGVWRSAPGGRLTLEPSNLGELLPLIVGCAGADLDLSVVIYEYQHRLQLRGSSRLVGRSVLRGRIEVDEEQFPFRAVASYRGRQVGAPSVGAETRLALPARSLGGALRVLEAASRPRPGRVVETMRHTVGGAP